MNWKKIIAAVSVALAIPTSAFAKGELWYDISSHLPQFKKLVVYPIKDLKGNFLIDENEKSESYMMNDYFNKRFVRKLKINTVSLGASLKENKEIRVDEEKYKSLYNNFPDEKNRATTVAEVTAANGYIIPQINLDQKEPHTSPAKTVSVKMKSWTEEKDGPNGDRTYDHRSWTVNHTIPEYQLMLYHMGIQYNMYNREGNKIMTYRNLEHTYGENYGGVVGMLGGLFGGKQTHSLKPDRYHVEIVKHIVDEFRKDFNEIQKNFKENKKKVRVPKTIGFKGVNLPKSIGDDEYSLKSCNFYLKDSAFKYTDLNVDYNGNGNANYFVQGVVNRYSLDRRWIEPYVTTYDKVISEEKTDWTDNNGNKHTKVVKKYQTEIVDHHGYWQYTATVAGTFNLLDSNGRVVVSHGATETDDKAPDAYRHLLKDFYKKVNDTLVGKR